MAQRRYVIVGEGAAGTTAAIALRGWDHDAEITVVTDEPSRPYYRAALTNYLLGELNAAQLWAAPEEHHPRNRLRQVVDQAVEVDLGFRQLHLAGGTSLPYDALLIATGARARRASFPGAQLRGVMGLRDMSDAEESLRMLRVTRAVRHAAVIGGGPLALEWAHAIHRHGAAATLFLRGQHFLPGTLDAVGSDLLTARLSQAGLQVRVADEVTQAVGNEQGEVTSLSTKRGSQRLECQMVAVAIGIEPRSELVKNGPFSLALTGAIEVDERLATNVAAVYAAGDVAAFQGRTLGLWAPAQEQALVAAANMVLDAGGTLPPDASRIYEPGAHYMATRLYDLDFASVGAVDVAIADQTFVDFPQGTGAIAYRKVFLREGRLVGALMLGEPALRVRRRGRLFKRLIDECHDVRKIAPHLLDDQFDLRAWLDDFAVPPEPAEPVGPVALAAPAAPLTPGAESARGVAHRRTSAFARPPSGGQHS